MVQGDIHTLHKNNKYGRKFNYITTIRNKTKNRCRHMWNKYLNTMAKKCRIYRNLECPTSHKTASCLQKLRIMTKTTHEHATCKNYICILCNFDYKGARTYNRHIIDASDRSIYHMGDSIIPKNILMKTVAISGETHLILKNIWNCVAI